VKEQGKMIYLKEQSKMIYDVAIIGGGPAGLTAGLYAGRAGLSTVLLEKMFTGGQAATTYSVENYPGFIDPIGGMELTQQMTQQAEKYGLEIQYNEVTDVQLEGNEKIIVTPDGEVRAKTIILAMGAQPRQLGLDSELRLRGRGVSYCATCDGALYRDKTVAVIGGGDTAVEDALFLAQFAKKIYVVHRRDEFRASKILQERVLSNEKITVLWHNELREIQENEAGVSGIVVENNQTQEKQTFAVDGVFVAVGYIPDTTIINGKIKQSPNGYIMADDEMRTSVEGVFVAGDSRQKTVYQIITAAGDGAVAAINAQRYIIEKA
jgi:thioredoxin reductase (NADPH)